MVFDGQTGIGVTEYLAVAEVFDNIFTPFY